MRIPHIPIISHSFLGKEQDAAFTVLMRWFLFYVGLGLLGVLMVLTYYAVTGIPLITFGLILIAGLILFLSKRPKYAMHGSLFPPLYLALLAFWGLLASLLHKRLGQLDNRSLVYYRAPISTQPGIWKTVLRYRNTQRWDVLYDFGRAIIEDKVLLPPLERVRLFEWVGVAAMHLGRYRDALILYQKALDELDDNSARAMAYNGLALSYLRLNNFAAARTAIESALQIDPTVDLVVYNALCIACAEKNLADVDKFARMILRRFPQSCSPESVLGSGLLSDPDLVYLRSSESFSKLFPELSQVSSDPALLSRARSVFKKRTLWLLHGGES
jgi:tetratricopeptide (TPR) repeat protein